MTIETLQDVEVFIDTLIASDRLWHADDLVVDIPNFDKLTNKDKLQEMMNEAKEVCSVNNTCIFDFYPACD